ncbi:hypothetical protein SCHPADRAFT_896995 [Schizopora paradoxa]|uniref:Uncharacterized protein n=1 Tax=Schizopora paradoxa TaxID=27342 RepID=A0A0H2QZR5_9AGAM|nr:hypothetical protein SCHPADRAFT_896995 [Schizopora paradoxa]
MPKPSSKANQSQSAFPKPILPSGASRVGRGSQLDNGNPDPNTSPLTPAPLEPQAPLLPPKTSSRAPKRHRSEPDLLNQSPAAKKARQDEIVQIAAAELGVKLQANLNSEKAAQTRTRHEGNFAQMAETLVELQRGADESAAKLEQMLADNRADYQRANQALTGELQSIASNLEGKFHTESTAVRNELRAAMEDVHSEVNDLSNGLHRLSDEVSVLRGAPPLSSTHTPVQQHPLETGLTSLPRENEALSENRGVSQIQDVAAPPSFHASRPLTPIQDSIVASSLPRPLHRSLNNDRGSVPAPNVPMPVRQSAPFPTPTVNQGAGAVSASFTPTHQQPRMQSQTVFFSQQEHTNANLSVQETMPQGQPLQYAQPMPVRVDQQRQTMPSQRQPLQYAQQMPVLVDQQRQTGPIPVPPFTTPQYPSTQRSHQGQQQSQSTNNGQGRGRGFSRPAESGQRQNNPSNSARNRMLDAERTIFIGPAEWGSTFATAFQSLMDGMPFRPPSAPYSIQECEDKQYLSIRFRFAEAAQQFVAAWRRGAPPNFEYLKLTYPAGF